MAKKKQCCDWHGGYAGHPCEVCDDKCRCAWIFGDIGEEKHILCNEHWKEWQAVERRSIRDVI